MAGRLRDSTASAPEVCGSFSFIPADGFRPVFWNQGPEDVITNVPWKEFPFADRMTKFHMIHVRDYGFFFVHYSTQLC